MSLSYLPESPVCCLPSDTEQWCGSAGNLLAVFCRLKYAQGAETVLGSTVGHPVGESGFQGLGGQESPPLVLFKLQLSPGKRAEGNNPAQCWRLGQTGKLVDALSLASAPGSDAIHRGCVPPGCMQPCAQRHALALLPAWSLTADSCCSGLVGRWNKPLQRNYNW